MRWLVTRAPKEDFGRVKVYRVKRNDGAGLFRGTTVWWTNSRPRCCECQTPLRGMSSSCVHAAAVRRHMQKAR